MTKKATDLSNLLGGARGARDVPRPQVDLPDPPEAPKAPPERRINVAISAARHKALKRLAVEDERTVQELVDEALARYLAEHQ